jgi:hypothetical protein
LSSVALASLMRLSLKKTAYVAVGECRVAGIRVRFGRDDKSKEALPLIVAAWDG